MTTSVRTDPLFAVEKSTDLTRRHLTQLANGTLAAVRIPFLGAEDCADAVKAFDEVRGGDGVMSRFGPALMDYCRGDKTLDADRYHADARTASQAWARSKPQPDPVAAAVTAFTRMWGEPLGAATVAGVPALGMTMREINGGALAHFDDVNQELAEGTFDQLIVAQLAFNVFVASPEEGGAVELFKHRWEPGDEEHRDRYGYTPEAVEGCQKVSFVPRLGEAVLFNSHHFHGIQPVTAGRRISFAFFVGVTDTGSLVSWS